MGTATTCEGTCRIQAGERESLMNVLNRHEVLHGESVDYGTEINSLKAMSLLYYIASVLGERGDSEAYNGL